MSSTGTVLGSKGFSLAANTRLVKAAAEFVATAPPVGSRWRVRAALPVQTLGFTADDTTGVVTPVIATSVQ